MGCVPPVVGLPALSVFTVEGEPGVLPALFALVIEGIPVESVDNWIVLLVTGLPALSVLGDGSLVA